MNDTPSGGTGTAAPPPPPPASPDGSLPGATDNGPRVSQAEVRDLARMERPATERKLFGVCAGIARHFDIDPTVVRIVFVVLIFFGGAGAVLYAALGLVLPDERSGRAVINVSAGVRAAVVIAAAVLAGLAMLGQGWNGLFFNGWSGPVLPVLVLGLIAVVWLITRDQQAAPSGPAGQTAAGAPVSYSGAEYAGYAEHADAATATTTDPATGPAPAPTPAAPRTRLLPAYVTPAEKAIRAGRTPKPPKPPKRGPILFWPTLAVIAVALGGLGWYDATGHAVVDGAYAALAVAITGIALLIGAFRGRPGGLVLLGAVSAVVMLGTTVVGTPTRGESLGYYPPSADYVRSSYTLGTGDLLIDLTQVDDPSALDGKQIDITGRTGRIRVILPADVGAQVDARVRVAGGIELGSGGYGGGFGTQLDGRVTAPPGSPTVDLDVDLRLGSIEVTQR